MMVGSDNVQMLIITRGGDAFYLNGPVNNRHIRDPEITLNGKETVNFILILLYVASLVSAQTTKRPSL